MTMSNPNKKWLCLLAVLFVSSFSLTQAVEIRLNATYEDYADVFDDEFRPENTMIYENDTLFMVGGEHSH